MAVLNPFRIELTRGPAVESSHMVHALLLDGDGKTVAAHGDAERLTFPRSSLKPLQAVALLESGGGDDISDAEVALACASHSGEEKHTTAVAAWLSRMGMTENTLECGPHSPYIAPSRAPSILCNNCSGKHTGMLALCRHMKVPAAGYIKPDHPAQARILATVAEFCETDIRPGTCGTDGCSAPNPVMPLSHFARGIAKFLRTDKMSDARSAACNRIMVSMMGHPQLVAGTGRLDTILMQAAKGMVVAKGGGEGLYAAIIPAKDRVMVLKAEDGAVRAVQGGVYAMLEKYHLVGDDTLQAIRPTALPVQKNWRGIEVGHIRIAHDI
jgi:L-asparaginase II